MRRHNNSIQSDEHFIWNPNKSNKGQNMRFFFFHYSLTPFSSSKLDLLTAPSIQEAPSAWILHGINHPNWWFRSQEVGASCIWVPNAKYFACAVFWRRLTSQRTHPFRLKFCALDDDICDKKYLATLLVVLYVGILRPYLQTHTFWHFQNVTWLWSRK